MNDLNKGVRGLLAVAGALCCLPMQAADVSGLSGPVRASALLEHTRVLSSDAFEGRGIGSPGEKKTVAYLTEQFKAMGLQPGNPDGTYIQKVPMVGISSKAQLQLGGCSADVKVQAPMDYVAFSTHVKPRVQTRKSDLVFVGYGVVAPEYGWDDYKDVDVRGKTIVMLINDPAIPDPQDPSKLDERMFKGNAMTYYGRWTYKYEIAAAKGAAAAIIVHETLPAAYPYIVVVTSNSREKFELRHKDGGKKEVPVRSWMRLEKAQEMFQSCGQDFAKLKEAALRKDFRPVTLAGNASFRLDQKLRKVDTMNVAAKLDGVDAQRKNEWLIYSAHWDHLGKQGDAIYHGAQDNASGTAALLELANAFSEDAKRGVKPARSVLFLATTAEESGLLGAAWYSRHPLYPLERTVADINIDGINTFGLTRSVAITGAGHTTMDAMVLDAAKAQGRTVSQELRPEYGGFFRADQFEFARAGLPGLYISSGNDYVNKPTEFGQQRRDMYTANDYHKPSDVIKPDWDLSGGAQDMNLLYAVGRRLSDGTEYPEFLSGSEFKSKQDALLKGVKR